MDETYSSNSFNVFPKCKKHILLLHGFKGCEKTSSIFGNGFKRFSSFLKSIRFRGTCKNIQERQNLEALLDNVIQLLLALYGAPLKFHIPNLPRHNIYLIKHCWIFGDFRHLLLQPLNGNLFLFI